MTPKLDAVLDEHLPHTRTDDFLKRYLIKKLFAHLIVNLACIEEIALTDMLEKDKTESKKRYEDGIKFNLDLIKQLAEWIDSTARSTLETKLVSSYMNFDPDSGIRAENIDISVFSKFVDEKLKHNEH